MSRRLADFRSRPPIVRVLSDEPERGGYFYPGEVADMLELESIDYRQLRRMFDIARRTANRELPPARLVTPRSGSAAGSEHERSAWARFSLRDVASVAVVLALAGGQDRLLDPRRRLMFRGIEEACAALRLLGYTEPLLQVPLARSGRTIVAVIRESVVDPTNGQVVLQSAEAVIRDWERGLPDPAVAEAIAAERRLLTSQELPETRREAHVVVWPTDVWPEPPDPGCDSGG